ncbi:hypothetical protein GYMLUDRAFT_1005745, partial [Collybiopsis luxurians FD-317 M1]
MTKTYIKVVADFFRRAIQLSLLLQKEAGAKMLKDFVRVATTQEKGKQGFAQVKQLRVEVCAFSYKSAWCGYHQLQEVCRYRGGLGWG